MVYGKLGRLPLSINIKMRMVDFWNRLVSNEHKFSRHLYRLMLSLNDFVVHELTWENVGRVLERVFGLRHVLGPS